MLLLALLLAGLLAVSKATMTVCIESADMTFPVSQPFKPDVYANIRIPGTQSFTPSDTNDAWSRIHVPTIYDCMSPIHHDTVNFPGWCCEFQSSASAPGAGRIVTSAAGVRSVEPFEVHIDCALRPRTSAVWRRPIAAV